MPISNGTFTVPNNFVQQYDQGQKKIRADLMDENFTDVAAAITQNITSISENDTAAVHKAGAETISGAKIFTEQITASGGVVGDVTGNVTGNAGTATKLETARTINGVSFDGTENITVEDATKVALDGSNLSGAAVRVVVETWHSGTEWYRVWSDGWIEQGGISANSSGAGAHATVIFAKPYSDVNYIIVAFPNIGSVSGSVGIGTANKATTGCDIYYDGSSGDPTSVQWYACGY